MGAMDMVVVMARCKSEQGCVVWPNKSTTNGSGRAGGAPDEAPLGRLSDCSRRHRPPRHRAQPHSTHHGHRSLRLRRLAFCAVFRRQGRGRGHHRRYGPLARSPGPSAHPPRSRHHIHRRVRLHRQLPRNGRQGRPRRPLRAERVGEHPPPLPFAADSPRLPPRPALHHIGPRPCRKKAANTSSTPNFNHTNRNSTTSSHWKSRKRSTRSNGANGKTPPISSCPPTVRALPPPVLSPPLAFSAPLDKTIKLWKVFEKSLRVVSESNHYEGQRPITPPRSPSHLKLPRMVQQDNIIAAIPRKVYANAHAYHIHSISVNSDQETYISADDLRVNLWNLNISDQSFSTSLIASYNRAATYLARQTS
jgi:hypothetical protein